MTGRFGVIGQPVAQSRSPEIHQSFASQFGHQISYERIDCAPGQFDATVRRFFDADGQGLNVTTPHKGAAFELVGHASARARIASAVNTISRDASGTLIGDNTDGTGLVRDLLMNLDVSVRNAQVLLLGAGGAARGIAAPLLGQRPAMLTIANRTFTRALELVENIAGLGNVHARRLDQIGQTRYDLVINATAASLDNTRLDIRCVVADALCYDLAYSAKPTPFMQWAQSQNARSVHDGWGMLVEQAAESYYIWHGVWPQTASLIAEHPR